MTKSLAETVLDYRQSSNQSQTQFADEAKISVPTLSRVERGMRPSPKTYMRIAGAMGVPISSLTALKAEKPKRNKKEKGAENA